MNARFFITDIVRAIKNKEVFKTSEDNIIRDFITPSDFYRLIQEIIDFKPINTALDCYTKSPVSKFDLLSELANKFGLKYEIDENVSIINATGVKLNYYSSNKVASKIGYKPKYSSFEGVSQEITAFDWGGNT
jgi:nucleoside-diphosphate-sugar epimerase